ncbi:MAG: tRNA pseudouridine(38-40) synthase TruA [Deferribacterota bacterium]|nr:tRNA pseudouridine(38-40) synthase TruA [Deferribacterota bacterium]
MLYNKKCVVEYNGSNFYGWQVQKNARTVQYVLEQVLERIYKRKIKIFGAGRTDSGVHAEGQVFNFKNEKYIENDNLLAGLNSLLPNDVVIKSVEDVMLNFHAQYDAKSKVYNYKIYNNKIRSALLYDRVWWVKSELSLNLLEYLFKKFIGKRDFKYFCKGSKFYRSTEREIYMIEIYMKDKIINIDIEASGFLRKMVRLIVGSVVKTAAGDKNTNNLQKAIYAAPSQGLYLKKVVY